MTLALIGIWVVCGIIAIALAAIDTKELELGIIFACIVFGPIALFVILYLSEITLWKASSTEKKR